jgi:hypothetical protein
MFLPASMETLVNKSAETMSHLKMMPWAAMEDHHHCHRCQPNDPMHHLPLSHLSWQVNCPPQCSLDCPNLLI